MAEHAHAQKLINARESWVSEWNQQSWRIIDKQMEEKDLQDEDDRKKRVADKKAKKQDRAAWAELERTKRTSNTNKPKSATDGSFCRKVARLWRPPRSFGEKKKIKTRSDVGSQLTGVVTKFNRDRGFGFIQPNDGSDDIFVHFSAIISPPDCKILEEDMEVSFNVDEGPKAINVKIIGYDSDNSFDRSPSPPPQRHKKKRDKRNEWPKYKRHKKKRERSYDSPKTKYKRREMISRSRSPPREVRKFKSHKNSISPKFGDDDDSLDDQDINLSSYSSAIENISSVSSGSASSNDYSISVGESPSPPKQLKSQQKQKKSKKRKSSPKSMCDSPNAPNIIASVSTSPEQPEEMHIVKKKRKDKVKKVEVIGANKVTRKERREQEKKDEKKKFCI